MSHRNQKNWVKPSEIVRTFKHFNRGTNLIVEVRDQLRTKDSLYIIPWQSYCYVVLHYVEIGLWYIPDGENHDSTDPDVQDSLDKMIGIMLVPRKFTQQTGIDYCASSAVVNPLEMAHQYKLGIKPDTLKVEKRLLQHVKKWLHPEPSKSMMNFREHGKRVYVCDICDSKFKTSKALCDMIVHSSG